MNELKEEHLIHELKEYATFKELIEKSASEYSNRIAYSYKKDPRSSDISKVSFTKLRADVRSLGTSLLKRDIKGKRVALIGQFSYEWAVVYFTVISIGAVLVPIDKDWSAEEMASTLKFADIDCIFAAEAQKSKAERVASETGAPVTYFDSAEGDDTLKSLVSEGRETFNKEPHIYMMNKCDPYALSLLVFTSGTTGKGKGVMLSQKAVLSCIAYVAPYMDFSNKTVGVLPPHHTYGSSVMVAAHVMIGAEVYISSGLKYISREMREQKPGHMVLVPLFLETFYRRILAVAKQDGKEKALFRLIAMSNKLRKIGIDLRKTLFSTVLAPFGGELKMIISGGAPINPEIIDFFESIGVATLNGYGITECAPIVAVNRTKNAVKGSVGNVIDIDEVRILEPNEDGEGEIVVKGVNVMLGYYKDPEATADAMTEDGFFKTGDYGKLDGDNVLYITGRKKNLIVLSNGKNVYPEEIENELVSVRGLLDIVVYEGQSKRGTEHNKIVAEIYPDKEYFEKNGITPSEEYFRPFVDEYNKRAAVYKRIDMIRVREEEFPKNTLRKIMRFKIDTAIE